MTGCTKSKRRFFKSRSSIIMTNFLGKRIGRVGLRTSFREQYVSIIKSSYKSMDKLSGSGSARQAKPDKREKAKSHACDDEESSGS